jgi:hypothetical protein
MVLRNIMRRGASCNGARLVPPTNPRRPCGGWGEWGGCCYTYLFTHCCSCFVDSPSDVGSAMKRKPEQQNLRPTRSSKDSQKIKVPHQIQFGIDAHEHRRRIECILHVLGRCGAR